MSNFARRRFIETDETESIARVARILAIAGLFLAGGYFGLLYLVAR